MATYVYDIKWDVDSDAIARRLEEIGDEEAAKVVRLPYRSYARDFTKEQRLEWAENFFVRHPEVLAELMGLPTEVEVPEDVDDFNGYSISDWLNETYGFVQNGFSIGAGDTKTALGLDVEKLNSAFAKCDDDCLSLKAFDGAGYISIEIECSDYDLSLRLRDELDVPKIMSDKELAEELYSLEFNRDAVVPNEDCDEDDEEFEIDELKALFEVKIQEYARRFADVFWALVKEKTNG